MSSSEQHIHSGFFAPMLDIAHERIGRAKTEAALATLGTSEEALRDPNAWVSSELTEAIVEALSRETGDPDLVIEAGRRVFSGPYLGVMKSLLRFGGTPKAMFGSLPKLTPRFNKVGTWTVRDLTDTMAEIEYQSVHERSVDICRGRLGQLTTAPVMFGLGPAEVEHPECMHRGGRVCRYVVRWEAAPSEFIPRLVGAAIGAGALGFLGVTLGLGPLGTTVLATIGVVGGVLAAHTARLDRVLEKRSSQMLQQDRALERSMISNEARYAELLEAKHDVEQRVEERTRELQETSVRLSAALDEVRELADSKTRFFANVSHELRTPLQLILGSLDELERGVVDAAQAPERLRVMARNARRLHHLIDQLLDLAKADAGNARVDRVAVHLPDLVQGTLEAFATMARAHEVRLRSAIGTSVTASVDPHWIESALTNLVANAIRHCAPGDEVTVRLDVHDNDVAFQVADTGPGIPEADLPRIFDRFVQSAQREGASRGTGLGLAIVQEAAKLHGGAASVQSTVGRGTTFTVRFPLVEAEGEVQLVRVSVEDAALPAADELREYAGPHPDAPLAIVAEDEPDLRTSIATTLAAHCRVIACADGQLALDHARRCLPDIVVSDLTMPRRSGLEVCTALRKDPETSAIPVILLTARRSTDDVLAGYDAGVDDYVGKPFHARELLARVRVQLRMRQLNREAIVRERMASIGMLSAEIAHHFRNPLNFVCAGLPVIKKHVAAEWLASNTQFWDTLVESAKRMELLTRDLPHLARGHEHANMQAMDPSESLRSAIRMIDATLPPDVTLETGPLGRATIQGRAGDLNQVVLNLLDNASRAVGVRGRLRLTARCEDDLYVIVVEDSGPGISESLQAHLFEAFVSSRAHGEGSGLGLAIAARVIAEHGGTIEAGRSEALGGALFRLGLPLQREAVT